MSVGLTSLPARVAFMPSLQPYTSTTLPHPFSFHPSSFISKDSASLFTAVLSRPDIKRSHQLRYVLRNRTTKDVYLVVLFTLYLKEDVNEDGSLKPEALKAYTSGKTFQDKSKQDPSAEGGHAKTDEHFDEEKVLEEARRSLSNVNVAGTEETSADDVD